MVLLWMMRYSLAVRFFQANRQLSGRAGGIQMLRRRRQPSRTPTVYVDGREYVVDISRQVFRKASYLSSGPGSIDFESLEGQQMWDQCMNLECRQCGEVTVELRHLTGIRCEGCGAWLCV